MQPTDTDDDDVPELVQDALGSAAETMTSAGIETDRIGHFCISFGLMLLEVSLCADHLADELGYVEEAVADVKSRATGRAN